MIFEGEYLNEKRKGKEYDDNSCTLIFEEEYLNGKRWSGKSYNKEGEVDF